MKNLIFSTALLMFTFVAFSKTLVIEGKYQNKNVCILNRINDTGVGYSAYEVLVNGKSSNDEVNTNTFEIDLSQYNLNFGNDVTIQINYKEDVPKVLNPDALKPQPVFETVTIKVDKNGLLQWTTKNELLSIPFVVEQFRWNKWIKVGEVQGKGLLINHAYSFQAMLHSGENRFRVRQLGYNGKSKSTPVATIVSGTIKPDYTITKKRINFTDRTFFEIYAISGEIVKKGYGLSADLADLSKGGYYLCYDNTVTEIKTK